MTLFVVTHDSCKFLLSQTKDNNLGIKAQYSVAHFRRGYQNNIKQHYRWD